MGKERPPLATVLKIYSLLLFAGGARLLVLGPATSEPRLTGMLFVTWACLGRAIGEIADPGERRRALRWFALGQCLAAPMFLFRNQDLWAPPAPTWPAALFLVGTLLIVLWRLGNRPSHAHSAEPARSRYEREIRRLAGEEERRRLARDLHDSIKQHLFAIQTSAATAQAASTDEPRADAIAQVRAAARDAMTEMETMLDQLRAGPTGVSGLVASLQNLRETTALRTGAKVEIETESLPPDERLPPGAAQALLRVAQEALSNVARHARASRIVIRLEGTPGAIGMSIRDDGSGFDAQAPAAGMGLRNMRTRAAELGGEFRVEAAPGSGTLVRVTLPLADARPSGSGLHIGVALLLLAIGGVWWIGPVGPNPRHATAMIACAGAAAIFLALHLLAKRIPTSNREGA